MKAKPSLAIIGVLLILCVLSCTVLLLPKKNFCEYPGKTQCTYYDNRDVLRFEEKQPLGTYVFEKIFRVDLKINYSVEVQINHTNN